LISFRIISYVFPKSTRHGNNGSQRTAPI
jgi:hypothetical protein